MMKTLFKTVLLSTIAVLAAKLSAQAQDYVVMRKGDTIPCKLSETAAGNIKYTINNPADLEKINQCCIVDYYIAKKKTLKRFVFINNDQNEWNAVLVNVIENGKISLYESVDSNPTPDGVSSFTTVWYVGKGVDSARVVKKSTMFESTARQSRDEVLGKMLADNKDVYDKYMADEKLSFKQIRNLIHLYNTGEPLKD